MNERKLNILLISYTFPPIGGMTPWRLFQLTSKFNSFNIDIVTVSAKEFHPIYWVDKKLDIKIPDHINVHRVYPGPSWKFASSLNKMNSRNKNYGLSAKSPFIDSTRIIKTIYNKIFKPMIVPDTRIDWFPWATNKCNHLSNTKKYDIIWSFGFPFTSHFVAWYISSLKKIPWIIEYGDPWSFGPDEILSMPKWRQKLDKLIETKMLERAQKIIVCTDETRIGFLNNFPHFEPDKIKTVTHGYDEFSYNQSPIEKSKIFRIVYTGIFYDDLREPYTFFKSLCCLPRNEYEVIIMGNIDQKYSDFVNNLGLGEMVKFLGTKSRNEVVLFQKSASVLLTFGWIGGYQIPAKVYEYIGARRPILNIIYNKNDASSTIINKYSRGYTIENNQEQLQLGLNHLFNLWKEDKLDSEFCLEPIIEFTWKHVSESMEKLLLTVVK